MYIAFFLLLILLAASTADIKYAAHSVFVHDVSQFLKKKTLQAIAIKINVLSKFELIKQGLSYRKVWKIPKT